MKEIYDLAEQYHNDGNNCVESVVKACNDGLELGLPDVAIRGVRHGWRYRPQWLRVRCAERFLPGYQFYRWQIGSV